VCQMCDEYENELVRMGLIEDAKKFREERQREHEVAVAADRDRSNELAKRNIASQPGAVE
jgi:hypothetical protein